MEDQATIYKVGFWAAVLASVFSIAYDIGQLAEWFDLMGSGGSPERSRRWRRRRPARHRECIR